MKKVLAIIIVIVLLVGGYYLYSLTKVKEISKIKEYNYTLYSDDTKIYKETFKELKDVLENNYNEIRYADLISELFVIDFYTLSNKKGNTDIGGLEFIYPEYVDEFTSVARKTVYKFVGSSKEIPIVKRVSIKEAIKEEYENDPNSYLVTVKVSYEKDLDYPEEVILRLVHSDKKLYIIEIK